jgi:TM2 domain-containing membrane protein YozV
MNCKFIFFYLSFTLFQFFANAQSAIESDFVKHLSQEKMRLEMQQYIHDKVHDDTMQFTYYMAKYAAQFDTDSSFLDWYHQSYLRFQEDTLALGFVSCRMLRKIRQQNVSAKWFATIKLSLTSSPLNDLVAVYFIKDKSPKSIVVRDYPALLQASLKKYKYSASKNPTKAALLSAVVPGLGKMYIGKFKLGMNVFILNSIFSYQTYESIHRFGMKHPISMINVILTSFFYAANIYGSYRDARFFKQERLQQFYEDAADYYGGQYFSSLFK